MLFANATGHPHLCVSALLKQKKSMQKAEVENTEQSCEWLAASVCCLERAGYREAGDG